ncbi:MAG: hypothetical protein OHK0022_08060 [Roseiflexaceae bacterium]
MIVCIDGNDGTGKTSLIALLRQHRPGITFQDRGRPTAMTDGGDAAPADLYLILTASVATCRKRLAAAGKSLDERYHTEADLRHYEQRFAVVARLLGAVLLDAEPPLEQVAAAALLILDTAAEQQGLGVGG